MKAEWLRCASDAEYFIQKYVYIQSEGGRMLFGLHLYQQKLLNQIHQADRSLVLKSRQLGISTLAAAYSLWLMLFKTDQSILAVAPDRDKAKMVLQKVVFAYENLPKWLVKDFCKADFKVNNTTMLALVNGSKFEAVSGSSKGARGKTATFMILDEAAFIENAEDLWASAQQTLATSNGRALVLSTPNGLDSFFQPLWAAAELGENDFIPLRLPWWVMPGRNQAWRDKQSKELGVRMAAQECDCSFLSSGNTFFESEDLEHYGDHTEEPLEMRGINSDLWIWEYAVPGRNYMAIVDTSTGNGADNSTIQVLDIFSGDQVAEYKGDLPPKQLAPLAVSLCIEFNNALLIIENTGIGHETITHTLDTNYTNIYYSPKGDTTDTSTYLNKVFDNDLSRMMPGFTTSTKTRPLVLHTMRQYAMDRMVKVRSKRTVNEMRTFIWKNGKAQAQSGYHDDLLLPYAIGLYLRDSALQYRAQGIEMQKAVLNSITRVAPVASLDNNMPGSRSFKNPYELQYGNQQYDISWLVRRK